MKSITVSMKDPRDIRESFKEAGFDKRDVDMELNHLEGTVTYSQPDPSRAKRKRERP